MTTHPQKSILVTGASSGIGHAAAYALLAAGFRVYAGVRKEHDAARLRAEAPADTGNRLETVELDVTNVQHVRSAVERIAADVGPAGLWGLFNNAGVSVAGPLEFVAVDELKRQFEVNVFAQHAVTQAFIPLLRRAQGRIVTTGSVTGFLAAPGIGPYSMSKHALEAFSDALRRELRPWGMTVSLLEPGTIATAIWRKGLDDYDGLMRAPPPGLVETYGGLLSSMRGLVQKVITHASSADVVARDVVHAFTARRPRIRYCMGADSRAQRWLSRLPDRWADALIARFLHWG